MTHNERDTIHSQIKCSRTTRNTVLLLLLYCFFTEVVLSTIDDPPTEASRPPGVATGSATMFGVPGYM